MNIGNLGGYYPAGAENDPDAPWNEPDIEPVAKDVEFTCTMRRTANVKTTDYAPGVWEKDEDGFGYRDGDDFTDTNWQDSYYDYHYDPSGLIDILKDVAHEKAARAKEEGNKRAERHWLSIASECEGWEMLDEEAYEE